MSASRDNQRLDEDAGRHGDLLRGRSLAVYLPDLSGGGTERLQIGLAPYFERAGLSVTMLLNKASGELASACPVPIVELGTDRQISGFPRLVSYLKTSRPDILVGNMEHMNIMALVARKVAHVPTRIVVSQHNTLSKQAEKAGLKHRLLPRMFRFALPAAAGTIAVSNGVADDLSATTGFARERIDVIYNGVVTDDFDARVAAKVDYPWLGGGDPLIVAVGRMVPQKDYPTLLRAFARVTQTRSVRLAILGEGPLRRDLEALAQSLGVADRVTMPGFLPNPLAVLARSRLLVLSSTFEGFGLVIAEALACGLPVVSTDCPYGPAEILENGRFGTLTPVGDGEALAAAIDHALDQPVDAARLKARGREFTVAHCAEQYLDLFRRVLLDGQPAKR